MTRDSDLFATVVVLSIVALSVTAVIWEDFSNKDFMGRCVNQGVDIVSCESTVHSEYRELYLQEQIEALKGGRE